MIAILGLRPAQSATDAGYPVDRGSGTVGPRSSGARFLTRVSALVYSPVMRFHTCTLLTTVVAVAAVVSRATPQATAGNGVAPAPAAQGGAFSEAQVLRGRSVFSRACADCHTTGQFTAGDGFQLDWKGRTFLEVIEQLRSTMPQNDPGVLTRREYLDILAFLLRENGVPTGDTDLPATDDALKSVRIVLPPGRGGLPDTTLD